MNAKESVATYCKAQAEINKIEKNNEEQRKALNERIKTCRSLLTDELTQKNMSCIEVFEDEATEPIYLRLKNQTGPTSITIDDILHVLKIINKDLLCSHAEKFENDLPKMVSATIQSYVKEEKQKNTQEKPSLVISQSKERGYTKDVNHSISHEIMQIAKDLIHARKELSTLKEKQTNEKKEQVSIQKEVESNVKEALKASDPKNMTTRVHMMQQDSEWVYYLRCKESERQVSLGIRKIIPIVENAVVDLLNEHGMSRSYNIGYQLDTSFWNALSTKISKQIELESSEKKVVSKLSLDRGAPRTNKKS